MSAGRLMGALGPFRAARLRRFAVFGVVAVAVGGRAVQRGRGGRRGRGTSRGPQSVQGAVSRVWGSDTIAAALPRRRAVVFQIPGVVAPREGRIRSTSTAARNVFLAALLLPLAWESTA